MKEIWKDIEGFPDYSVSNFGRVMSHKWGREKVLVGGLDTNGYPIVTIRLSGRGHTKKVHQLVCRAFVSLVPGKTYVHHVDGNKQNNHFSNLQWVTNRENVFNHYKGKRKLPIGIYNHGSGFFVRVYRDGVPIGLGTYRTLKEAILVRAKDEINPQFVNL